MAGITAIAALGIFVAPSLDLSLPIELVNSSIILMAGGLELMVLSWISQNPRFIRAINAKYQKDIEAFQKTKTLVDYYNELTLESQQRFDKLRRRVKEVRDGFKKLKEKRLRLLEMRMDNYYKVRENKEVIEEQLQTIEEMVEYIKDQPMTLQNTEREDIMIDNLLFETEQTQQTMEEIENLMASEFYPGIVDDIDADTQFNLGDADTPLKE